MSLPADSPESSMDRQWTVSGQNVNVNGRPMERLQPGDLVEVQGLQGRRKFLNGHHGRILAFVVERCRYGVKLDGVKEPKSIKAEDLRKVMESNSDERCRVRITSLDGAMLHDAEHTTNTSLTELTSQLPRPEDSCYCTLLSGDTLLDKSFPDLASVLHLVHCDSVEIPVVCLSLIWHRFPALLPEFEGMSLELMTDALMESRDFDKWCTAMATLEALDIEQREIFNSALRPKCSVHVQKDIELVVSQCRGLQDRSEDWFVRAVAALVCHDNDLVEAIMKMSQQWPN